MGNNLYKIENVPFYAYGVNFHDIVRAIPNTPDSQPEVIEVVKYSGHRTLRVFFKKHISRDQQEEYLSTLASLTISYERMNSIYFSLDMQPNGDYQAVFDHLVALEEKDILEFETCEARVEGSFDSLPEEDETSI